MTEPGVTNHLTLQLLEWLSARPLTYEDVIDAWGTSCPRMSIWEDALADGLVEYGARQPATVELTRLGRGALGRDQG